MISQSYLHSLLSYDPLSGIFRWKVAPAFHIPVGSVAGTQAEPYICITVDKKRYQAHRLAWLYVYGKWPTKFIDHIDQNKSNNAIANLREATHAQNMQNVGIRSHNTSGIKGIRFIDDHFRAKPWKAQLTIEGKVHVKYFACVEDAVEWRQGMVKSYHPFAET